MIITARNMVALFEANRQRYIQNYRPVLRHEFPEFWMRFDGSQIDQILMDQCAYAGKHGLNSGRAANLLFTLRLRLGREFPDGEDFGWARAILNRRGCEESELLDAIEASVWGDAA